MQKGSPGKKIISGWLILAIIILILLLLGFFGVKYLVNRFVISYQTPFNQSLPNETNNYAFDSNGNPDLIEGSPDGYGEGLSSSSSEDPREYRTSDKLSTITFSKVVDYVGDGDIGGIGDSWKANVNIKVTGYMQERNPTESRLNRQLDRWYSFKDSNVKWEISASERRESENCLFVYSVSGAGSKPIEQWNVDTGDTKLSMVPVPGWGSWALTYNDYGFYSNTPEIALEGFVLFPIVWKLETTRLDEHSICGDYYATERHSVETKNIVFNPNLPLKLINVDINQKDYSGSLQAAEDSGDTPEGSNAMFEDARLDLLMDIPYDLETWNVNWDVHLP